MVTMRSDKVTKGVLYEGRQLQQSEPRRDQKHIPQDMLLRNSWVAQNIRNICSVIVLKDS